MFKDPVSVSQVTMDRSEMLSCFSVFSLSWAGVIKWCLIERTSWVSVSSLCFVHLSDIVRLAISSEEIGWVRDVSGSYLRNRHLWLNAAHGKQVRNSNSWEFCRLPPMYTICVTFMFRCAVSEDVEVK